MPHRICEAITSPGGIFQGSVEVDEIYICGKKHNKHNSRKLKDRCGSVGKEATIGV